MKALSLRKLAPVLIAAAMALASCSTEPPCSTFMSLNNSRWLYGDTLTFVPTLPDSVEEGVLVLSLRHNNSYPFSNLWIEVSIGDRLRDTVEVRMADVMGNWQGNLAGAGFVLNDTLMNRIALRQDVEVKVRHIMRPDTLPGIERVGLIFNRIDY